MLHANSLRRLNQVIPVPARMLNVEVRMRPRVPFQPVIRQYGLVGLARQLLPQHIGAVINMFSPFYSMLAVVHVVLKVIVLVRCAPQGFLRRCQSVGLTMNET